MKPLKNWKNPLCKSFSKPLSKPLTNKGCKYFDAKYYNKGSSDWETLSKKCKQRAGYKCQSCGKDFNNMRFLLEAHHIIPLSSGGRNTLSNLICLCRSCHHKRHREMRRKTFV